ncbi:MAG: GNAT family N-acetyltransferase [Lachnospiraceae bacterium]|nr:GNAT family N-acetyltransferase [Lachnospiraceae bacterium]
MNYEIYYLFKRNFPYVNREENTAINIIDNENNIIYEKRNSNNELIGCAIVNKNAILLLAVDEKYRNLGIGSELLKKCEDTIVNHGYDNAVLGVGFDYLMPGVPTSKKYTESVHENLCPQVDDKASTFFEKRGYEHSWKKCNCFDMKMSLKNLKDHNESIGNTINGITFRWAVMDDLEEIIACADDACQYQEEKFSVYYRYPGLYEAGHNQKVLVAVKNNIVVGALIVSVETEGSHLGCVGCTCVSVKESHQGIGTSLVRLGTKYLKDIGLSNASLGYTYTGLDKMYGAVGYEISTYYFMGEKSLRK